MIDRILRLFSSSEVCDVADSLISASDIWIISYLEDDAEWLLVHQDNRVSLKLPDKGRSQIFIDEKLSASLTSIEDSFLRRASIVYGTHIKDTILRRINSL